MLQSFNVLPGYPLLSMSIPPARLLPKVASAGGMGRWRWPAPTSCSAVITCNDTRQLFYSSIMPLYILLMAFFSNDILNLKSTPNNSIPSENLTWLASCSALSHCLPTLGAPATPSTAPRKMYTVPPPSYGAPTLNYIGKKLYHVNLFTPFCTSF